MQRLHQALDLLALQVVGRTAAEMHLQHVVPAAQRIGHQVHLVDQRIDITRHRVAVQAGLDLAVAVQALPDAEGQAELQRQRFLGPGGQRIQSLDPAVNVLDRASAPMLRGRGLRFGTHRWHRPISDKPHDPPPPAAHLPRLDCLER